MGPWATYILAGYGADVIKVEAPDGDVMRYAGPSRHHGMGSLFMFMNRGKRSIVLDLKRPEARDALLRVCERADVFVTNVRPAAMRRLGLGYEDVAAVNARIVYVDLVGYGQDGPYAAKPAYDDLIQGISGLAATFRRVGDGEPRFVPALIADRITGMNAVHAVLAALFRRERSGSWAACRSAHVRDDGGARALRSHRAGIFSIRRPATSATIVRSRRTGGRCARSTVTCAFCCTPRSIGNDFSRSSGCRSAMPVIRGCPIPPSGGASMMRHTVSLRRSSRRVRRRSGLRRSAAADIPVVPLEDVADLLDDEHLRATGFFRGEAHPSEGALRSVRRPLRFSDDAGASSCGHAPRLGEHGEEVLARGWAWTRMPCARRSAPHALPPLYAMMVSSVVRGAGRLCEPVSRRGGCLRP